MSAKSHKTRYQVDIGIETHVQLKSATKLFAAVANPSEESDPNTSTSPLCFGLPGTLPVLNFEALKLAIRAGLALKGEIAQYTKFDRKHYFYPDLPKGYQITQYDNPIVASGEVVIPLEKGELKVGIERAHLEEDAGKSIHPSGADYSLVDLNRAGTPLLEIVSRPDMHSAQEAKAYAQEIYNLMRYAQASDADLYQGNMRFDVNISLRPEGEEQLGVRSEIKNLNSFRSVERAAEYEIKRQTALLEKGKAVIQETRGWDEAKGKTVSQRGKEEAHDYRYFPEPDLPPLSISDELLAEIKAELPLTPNEIRSKLAQAGLDYARRETLLAEPAFVELVLAVTGKKNVKRIANWLSVDVRNLLNEEGLDPTETKLTSKRLESLSEMVEDGKLSSTAAKMVLAEMLNSAEEPAEIAARLEVIQLSGRDELEALVDEVIAQNPQAVADYRAGEAKAIGFLVGQVMRLSRGQANPPKVRTLLNEKLKL